MCLFLTDTQTDHVKTITPVADAGCNDSKKKKKLRKLFYSSFIFQSREVQGIVSQPQSYSSRTENCG